MRRRRRHTNTTALRSTKRGKRVTEVERIAEKLGIAPSKSLEKRLAAQGAIGRKADAEDEPAD